MLTQEQAQTIIRLAREMQAGDIKWRTAKKVGHRMDGIVESDKAEAALREYLAGLTKEQTT